MRRESGAVVERYEYHDYGQEHITLADGATTVAPNAHSGRFESLVGNWHHYLLGPSCSVSSNFEEPSFYLWS